MKPQMNTDEHRADPPQPKKGPTNSFVPGLDLSLEAALRRSRLKPELRTSRQSLAQSAEKEMTNDK